MSETIKMIMSSDDEIVKKWETTGLLDGLHAIWKAPVANCLDKFAHFLLDKKEFDSISMIIFPLLRRICNEHVTLETNNSADSFMEWFDKNKRIVLDLINNLKPEELCIKIITAYNSLLSTMIIIHDNNKSIDIEAETVACLATIIAQANRNKINGR